MGLWEDGGTTQFPKILSARAEVTFRHGFREYIILVKAENTAGEREATYRIQAGGIVPYRFKQEQDAMECAIWLVGKEYLYR